jgi:hypothetical protein
LIFTRTNKDSMNSHATCFQNCFFFNTITYIVLIHDLQLQSKAIIVHVHYIKILCLYMILQVFCNKTETQSWLLITVLKVLSFCFLIYSQMMVYWKLKRVSVAGVFTTNIRVVFDRYNNWFYQLEMPAGINSTLM